ncbi:MAG: VCBS repeat-containing protein, partial [Planctomycetota bacterium]
MLAIAIVTLASATRAQDFNGNGTRDSVDLRDGTSQDLDHDGIPDEVALRRTFSAAVEHHSDGATVTQVNGLALLDADLDGDLDLMVASASGPSDSNLTLWRNEGGPGLVFAQRTFVSGAACNLLRAHDLDGDGRLDLVASDSGFPQVLVLLASGPGTFAAPTRLTAGARGVGLEVADLDADGDADLALTGGSNNTVQVFLNHGDGSFAARQDYAVGQQPSAVAAADFTGDGLADLAVANSFVSSPGGGTVTLLRNAGAGLFSPHATLVVPGHAETSLNSEPRDLKLVDTDLDGDADLLVSSRDSNSLQIFTSDGAGAFANTQTLGPLEVIGGSADRFLCQDLDGDLAPEIAWSDSAARTIRMYDNTSGSFSLQRSYAAGSEGPSELVGGDLDGDGVVDLVAAGNTSSAFSVLLGIGELTFRAVEHLRRPDLNFKPLLADFTGDGLDDLASYATFDTPTTFRIAPGLGDGRFGAAQLVDLPSPAPLLPRDVDADGDLDILGVGNGGHRYCKLNHGDGTFADPLFSDVIDLNGNFQTADIDNDGNLDVLWTDAILSNQPHFIRISRGDGQGHFAPYQEIVTPPFLGAVWTGDLSGDGFPEIFAGVGAGVVGPLGLETVLVYPNNGDGTFGAYEAHNHELMPNFAGTVGGFAWVDIDGDGDEDLLGQMTYTWWYRNTGHQLEAPVQLGGFANYSFNEFGPTIHDMDKDGALDFVGVSRIGSLTSPAVFFNDGAGGFGPRLALMRY